MVCGLYMLLNRRYGFGSNKRIVLYDTLINQCSEEQVTDPGWLAGWLGGGGGSTCEQ